MSASPASVRPARAAPAGWAIALASTLAYSTAAPVAAAVLRLGTHPTQAVVLRLWLAAALLLATLAVAAPWTLRLDRRGLLATSISGLGTGVSLLFFFWALTRLEASIAALLFSLHPLVVLALLAARGEPLTARNGVRLVLGLSGVYFLTGAAGRMDWWGVTLALLATFTSALPTVFTQWFLRGYNGLAVTLYMVGAMAVTVTLAWLATGAPWVPPSPPAWAGLVALAVVPTYLARLTMFAAIQRLGGGQVALLVPLETLLTLAWSALFLGDRLAPVQLLGSGLILLSAALARANAAHG